jgi:predicted kinase
MQPLQKLLIQMAGSPGSGKSTMSKALAEKINAVIFDHDVYRSFFLEIGTPFHDAAKHTYSLQWVFAEDMLRQGRNVIIDSTCNYREVLDQGTAIAQKFGYDYWYVECKVNDIEILQERLQGRIPLRSQRTSVDELPPDSSASRYNEGARERFKKWMDQPCRPDDHIIVVDSSGRLEGCVDQVLQLVMP